MVQLSAEDFIGILFRVGEVSLSRLSNFSCILTAKVGFLSHGRGYDGLLPPRTGTCLGSKPQTIRLC
jgi:hypothetical protein